MPAENNWNHYVQFLLHSSHCSKGSFEGEESVLNQYSHAHMYIEAGSACCNHSSWSSWSLEIPFLCTSSLSKENLFQFTHGHRIIVLRQTYPLRWEDTGCQTSTLTVCVPQYFRIHKKFSQSDPECISPK